jgi:hypothetical protein
MYQAWIEPKQGAKRALIRGEESLDKPEWSLNQLQA